MATRKMKMCKSTAKCGWNMFSGRHWAGILGAQPQFADRCDWDKLDDKDWSRLLTRQPQFADKRDQAERNNLS